MYKLHIHIAQAFKCLVLLQESSKRFSATAQGSLDHLVIFFHLACAWQGLQSVAKVMV